MLLLGTYQLSLLLAPINELIIVLLLLLTTKAAYSSSSEINRPLLKYVISRKLYNFDTNLTGSRAIARVMH